MRVILQDNKRLIVTLLPEEVDGSFWLTDSNNKNLINIEAVNNKWVLKTNDDIKTIDLSKEVALYSNSSSVTEVELKEFSYGNLYSTIDGTEYKYFCLPYYDSSMIQTEVNWETTEKLAIGRADSSTIRVNTALFSDEQIEIHNSDGKLTITNKNINMPMFINNKVYTMKEFIPGDYVFIGGFCLFLCGNVLIFNNPNNSVAYNQDILKVRSKPINDDIDYSKDLENNIELYRKEDYFQNPPRFKKVIEDKEYTIDTPPNSEITDDTPAIFTIGPMFIMGIISAINVMNVIRNIINKETTIKDSYQSIITAVVTLIGSMLFPIVQDIYTKHKTKSKEKKRIKLYTEYLNSKQDEITKELENEKQILKESYLPLSEVEKVSINKDRTLWERKINHFDFLTIRLGLGNMPSSVSVNFPEEKFSLEKDQLMELGRNIVDSSKEISDVPVVLSLTEKRFVSFIGNSDYLKKYIDGIILQLITYQSYDNLNIVILSDDKDYWKKYSGVPHFWSVGKDIRYIAVNSDEVKYVSSYLLNVLNSRANSFNDKDNNTNKETNNAYLKYMPYYVVIADSTEDIKKNSFISEMLNNPVNLGFSLIVLSEKIDNLPNEINEFVNVNPQGSTMFESTLISGNQVPFILELPNNDLSKSYYNISNTPIDIAGGKYILPSKYAFLEMYDVGNVNQLNISNRWKSSNITQTLAAPVGVNEDGELFVIDLHERAHGPHGLVAGMTGSGKSEWIITYILSMCINYHPYEVQFVLIDYKGGGLAGTFENKETGFKLPHLAGTITNLDVTEISRSLASINSELKRRQALFNKARDMLGESSIDIYKYQRMYREGKIETPISHLFIICDEFAELKAQQPEFMDQLISTARIGRSLGVHLILATQKPSGVVDDQIWSNSKFRICLKVQEKADSKDMILVPDAALLKEPGRFYLQVGYNEFFAKGQSAYAGSPYYESDKRKAKLDTSLVFVNEVGEVTKEINTKKEIQDAVYKGEELPFILKAIKAAADKENISVKDLWLPPIPAVILIEDLKQKYGYKKENYILNPVIGEYDVPSCQEQRLLTLPLSKDGNTIIYGASGSGKEESLYTIVYSLMTTYVALEVNMYLVDCGSEGFNNFRKSPIVGDVMISTDEEKIKNLFKKINRELEARKKLFTDYNSNYYYYCKNSGKTLPNIITVINNFEAFQELYPDYGEELSSLSRDCEKYGIFFILSLSSTNGARLKLTQNFKQNLVLQMNDDYDYRSILGNGNRVIPSALKGRGVVKTDDIYEMQIASITKEDNVVDYIKKISSILRTKAQSMAPNIPVLPEVVDIDFLSSEKVTINSIPIGVNTETLQVAKYNFVSDKVSLIMSNDDLVLNKFINSLVNYVNDATKDIRLVIFTNTEFNGEYDKNVIIIDKEFGIETGLTTFEQYLNGNGKQKNTLLLFVGLGDYYESLGENQNALENIINKAKTTDLYNIAIVDTTSNIKKYSYDAWFTNNVSDSNGIWIGPDIQEQMIVRVKNARDIRGDIKDNNGFVIERGIASKIKIIELFKEK